MSSKTLSEGKAALLENVQQLLVERVSENRAEQSRYFAEAFLRRIPAEEVSEGDAGSIASLLASLLKFMARCEPGEARIRVYNPTEARDGWTSTHTIIEMIQQDKPFLVDTANLVLSELGLGVHIIVHPVVHTQRDKSGRLRGIFPSAAGKGEPESVMHLQVDRQSDPQMLKTIEHQLAIAMRHVALAVT